MVRPTPSLALTSGARSGSNRPANGLSTTATTATLRSGGVTSRPASRRTSSTKVRMRLMSTGCSPSCGPPCDNYLTAKLFKLAIS